MIPYYQTDCSKHRVNNKPIGVGYKIWVFEETYGYVVQCSSVQKISRCKKKKKRKRKKRKQLTFCTKQGLGENVVLREMERLPPTLSYHLFMDSYSTSFCLLSYLGVNKILAIGVLNKNRIHKCTITRDE